MRRTTTLASLALAAGSFIAAPASTAGAANQNGLVNVNIEDVTVQVPVAVAANVCDVTVGVLVDTLTEAPTDCQAGTIALAEDQSGPGGSSNQRGLVNVNLQDVDVQVPIGIAANICDVTVGVLVQNLDGAFTDCDSGAMSIARI
jgi:hypothetical protein